LGNESIGVLATTGTTSTLNGAVTVGNSSAGKSAIGVVANGGSNITIAGSSIITAGNGGIGVYAEGAGTIVTVSNTGNITVGTDGIYMYSKDATLNFTGNITANNQIGIVADGGTINAMGASTITVQNGGIGAYVKNAAPAFGTTTIAVQGGNASKYSMGVYYDGVSSIGTAPTITQTGSYTIGMVLNNSIGTTAGGISIGGAGITNQVGVMAKGNSNLTVAGTVTVSGGNNNIGVYGENSIITANNNITVAAPSSSDPLDPMKYSSIGIYMNKGSYIGTGNVSVGNNSIGIYGKDLNGGSISQTGTVMTVGNNGVGIYGTGTGNGTENINLTMTTGITLGNNNSIGVYAKNINSSVTGDMYVGTNTSIGIVSEGNGNVTYSGDLTIEDKGTGVNDTGSVGIYKLDGTGTVNVLAGNWNVGNNGYGIFLKQAAGQSATINNNADMTLETAAVGIFSSGKNIVNNIGDITVGKTDVNGDHNNTQGHLNSVGMYISGGTVATSSGIITVNHDHSVGVYGEGEGTRFTNTGTINVDNGGVGILVRNGAVAVNAVGGDINLGGTLASCGAVTIGMASYGAGATIINNGTITVNQGAGMLVGTGTIFENNGTIIVNNGVGIEGIGSTINAGHIVVNGGIAVGSGGLSTANVGAVEIKPDGTIKINGNYTSIGGTLTTAGAIIVDGAYVDVTTGTPLFNANSVSGEVKILSNFATTGNGRTYEIEGFVNTAMGTITGTKLTPVVSPLYVAKVTDKGSLVIAKRDYNDMTLGKQFEEQYKGLDNIFKDSDGEGRDGEILKSLNKYLNDTYLNDPSGADFEREMSRTLAETRGDIYATIQGRMQDINRAFDNSFYELESSYNMTKDSSKYSVIYTDGNYKDSTLGIDDYDYKVMGLLYMKEKEGTEYGSKYGYTVGFAGSKFDFDDGGSKEDVYSLRVGAHRIKNLSEEHKVSWLSRIELGYNRHIAKRKLELDKTYENKGEYNTYSVAFDNRLTKVIYTDLSRQLDVYADLDL
ncbi:beta strand repeat-containing protein, partial [Fusobacterium ulcerans]|uniref:beta strand repeat-containing protein n=3 Tax=Fusobacterium ulcerans TaxID=861 RepID=UPI0038732016|nr:autotransporter-associated N-terminal domain-containing protein [Fusobacterium ulcerans]